MYSIVCAQFVSKTCIRGIIETIALISKFIHASTYDSNVKNCSYLGIFVFYGRLQERRKISNTVDMFMIRFNKNYVTSFKKTIEKRNMLWRIHFVHFLALLWASVFVMLQMRLRFTSNHVYISVTLHKSETKRDMCCLAIIKLFYKYAIFVSSKIHTYWDLLLLET